MIFLSSRREKGKERKGKGIVPNRFSSEFLILIGLAASF